MSLLDFGAVLQNPVLLCEPRPGFESEPLENMTSFEMLRCLDQHAWEWRPLPAPTNRKDVKTLEIAMLQDEDNTEVRVFYGGVSRAKSYLMVLVEAARAPMLLMEKGIQVVQHFRDSAYYRKVLRIVLGTGETLAALEDDAQITDDASVTLAPIEDEKEEHGDSDLCEDDHKQILEGIFADAEAPLSATQSRKKRSVAARPAPAFPANRRVRQRIEEVQEVQELEEVPQPTEEDAPEESPEGPEDTELLEKVPPLDENSLVAGRAAASRIGCSQDGTGAWRWGPFTLTQRPTTIRHKTPGWQAACPFHKKSRVTPLCRLTKKVDDELNIEDHVSTLCKLLYWCCYAIGENRQWKHLKKPIDFSEVPTLAVLNQIMPTADTVPDTVLPDEELDDLERKRKKKKKKKKKKNDHEEENEE